MPRKCVNISPLQPFIVWISLAVGRPLLTFALGWDTTGVVGVGEMYRNSWDQRNHRSRTLYEGIFLNSRYGILYGFKSFSRLVELSLPNLAGDLEVACWMSSMDLLGVVSWSMIHLEGQSSAESLHLTISAAAWFPLVRWILTLCGGWEGGKFANASSIHQKNSAVFGW